MFGRNINREKEKYNGAEIVFLQLLVNDFLLFYLVPDKHIYIFSLET